MRLGDHLQVIEWNGIDQDRADALAAQLNEVGPMGVPVTRCPLGVDGDRTRSGREGFAAAVSPATVTTGSGVPPRGAVSTTGVSGAGTGSSVT